MNTVLKASIGQEPLPPTWRRHDPKCRLKRKAEFFMHVVCQKLKTNSAGQVQPYELQHRP